MFRGNLTHGIVVLIPVGRTVVWLTIGNELLQQILRLRHQLIQSLGNRKSIAIFIGMRQAPHPQTVQAALILSRLSYQERTFARLARSQLAADTIPKNIDTSLAQLTQCIKTFPY
ncbi:hypothetical protein [Burkholderia stagnalis]|uniref:hypothetical protein n=1 Tax=Burkholderia stagnalis TaxID=1503054 RepID=UPI00325ACE9E